MTWARNQTPLLGLKTTIYFPQYFRYIIISSSIGGGGGGCGSSSSGGRRRRHGSI